MNGTVQVAFTGYFGNNLYQYAAVRKYAQIIGAKFESPEWVGRDLFGLTDPNYSSTLPEVSDQYLQWGRTDICLSGYFQTPQWVGLLSRAELRRWFILRSKFFVPVLPTKAYTAAHLRQGDYIGNPVYANVPERSYDRACVEHSLGPIDVWARQNSPRVASGVPDFLPDFLVLMRASILLRANSTFSWWAGVLGDADIYAPLVTDHTGEYDADFVRGNWPRLVTPGMDLHLPA